MHDALNSLYQYLAKSSQPAKIFFNHGWTRINTDEVGLSLIRVHPSRPTFGVRREAKRHAALDYAIVARLSGASISARRRAKAPSPLRSRLRLRLRRGKLQLTWPRRSAAKTGVPAHSKGARVCDPQELCQSPGALTIPARRSLPSCCGSQSRAPQNRRGPRRFGQLLID